MGEDVENIILSLLQNADYDVERASRGIVYIDEIDKIAKKSEIFDYRDVSGGCPAGTAEVIEGTLANIRRRGDGSIPSRNSSRWTQRTSCSFAAGPSTGLKTSSPSASGPLPWIRCRGEEQAGTAAE